MTTAPSEQPTIPNALVPEKLTPPINVSRVKNENGVKKIVKELLDAHGWFHFAPGAGGYSAQGISDRLALKNGVFLAVEVKFLRNKPKPLQKAFAAQVMTNDGFAFCVNESNIDHFAWWLESFEIATQYQRHSLEVPAEHGSRLLNAISALTDPFAE